MSSFAAEEVIRHGDVRAIIADVQLKSIVLAKLVVPQRNAKINDIVHTVAFNCCFELRGPLLERTIR